ncbi:MAG: hypothetical protein QOI10_1532 [Solirubrobacterales bacterium]|jgi:hypothetical protein|nr:hypothetical protein [Solirubrobacterales bacterium]
MFRSQLVAAALAAIVLAVPALSLAGAKTVEVEAKLKGKDVIPGAGSTKGKGEIHVFLKPGKSKLCFNFDVSKLDPMLEGSIHKGVAGNSGPQKVTLFQDQDGLAGDGSYEGCVKNVKSSLMDKIAASPEGFYAEIDTRDFPEGAIRGQLELST